MQLRGWLVYEEAKGLMKQCVSGNIFTLVGL